VIDHDEGRHDSVDDARSGADHEEADHDTVREATATGHPQVDGVLATLETLSELPVEQHVTVFEAAHVGLRDALSNAGPAAADRG
jgi:hypothetical protein